jgi:anti-sigma B factor antagonist
MLDGAKRRVWVPKCNGYLCGSDISGRIARVDEQVVGPELVLTTDRNGDQVVLTVQGELDAYTAPGLEDHISGLLNENVSDLVLDLSQTGFLDSSGLRALLTVHRRLEGTGGHLALRNASEPVLRLLEITGLREHFGVPGAAS